MKTISLVQYKGGVGKTTVAALLCKVLAAAKYRVLAIDLDRHQYHLSSLLGGSASPKIFRDRSPTTFASGLLSNLLLKTAFENLNYITLCESFCDWNTNDTYQLSKRFAFFNFKADYDYVIIDTPPGFGKIHELAISVSDHIVLPIDLSSISVASVERFCLDLHKREHYQVKSYSILRNFVSRAVNAAQFNPLFHASLKNRVLSHSLSADERIRSITSGYCDFLSQYLPQHIVSQLFSMVLDLFQADPVNLAQACNKLCFKESLDTRFNESALIFENAETVSTDFSVSFS